MSEEEFKPYTSSTEELPQYVRRRNVPDVPEDADVDYMMEHLNDPNMDLRKPMGKPVSSESFKVNKTYAHSDDDAESRSAPSRASRDSTAIEFDDESPYPEVRAAVSSIDDPLMPVNTFRMWFLGIFLTVLLAGVNQIFDYRAPSVFITGIVGQLISLPLGKFLEWVLPTAQFKTFNRVWSLNPGPFNIKEHVCITVMINVAYVGAYTTDVLATQQMYYHQHIPFMYQILITLGTQIFGFSLGGMLRQFVVWPASMIWPSTLVSSALFNTLHKNYGIRGDRGHMRREKFFLIVCACSFVWYWVPGYLFTALSVFNWVCWIAPTNVKVNTVFGSLTGLGMSAITFDWAQITFIGSPLVTPWWSEMNTIVSVFICFWFVVPLMYFNNVWYTGYLPLSAYVSFDRFGAPYNISAVVLDGEFQPELYAAYSPIFMTAALCMAYFISFAAFGAIFTHTFLWFGRDIVRRFRSSLKDERDIHSRLMQAYPEVPTWWYILIGVLATAFTFIAVEIFPTKLPIWAAALALFISMIAAIPLAMLQAITNQHVALQVVEEMIAGYALPGRPVANIVFKAIAYTGSAQGVTFASDLKLGHYMKIPPRTMFNIQLVAAVITSFVVLGVQNWMFSNIAGICTPAAIDNFVCPSTNVFATASVTWGGIGPARLFSAGGMYNPLLYGFLFGAVAPIPFYYLARRYPLSFWRYINIPVFCGGVGAIPAASAYNYAAWALTGFIFNFIIRRRYFRWWMRYNYILSAALDAGLAISLIVIFFAVQYPRGGTVLNWWGNTVWQNTNDAMGVPLLVSETGTFGPSSWS